MKALDMRASGSDRTSDDSTAILDSSEVRRDQDRGTVEVYPAEPRHWRRRFGRVKLCCFSPVTYFLLAVVCCSVIVYLIRDPLDQILPGFKKHVESIVGIASQGINQPLDAVDRTYAALNRAAVWTVSSHSGARTVRLPYFPRLPARPRLAVSYLERSAEPRECKGGCYLVRMPDNSLAPTIKKGQLLLIDSGRTAVSGDVVWAAYGGRPYLRRFFSTGAVARLAPDNRSYREIRGAVRDIHINGVFLRVAD